MIWILLWAAGWVIGLKYWCARNESMTLSDMCLTVICSPFFIVAFILVPLAQAMNIIVWRRK